MNEDVGEKEYKTFTLPHYVVNYFGGRGKIKMTKVSDKVWRFKGNGKEVVLDAETAWEARRKVRKFVAAVTAIEDYRVVRHKDTNAD